MPDITMCEGEGCEARVTCYRFLATPSRYQYYMGTPDINGGCEYYINHNRLSEWKKNILKNEK